jgi:hypothetical protein
MSLIFNIFYIKKIDIIRNTIYASNVVLARLNGKQFISISYQTIIDFSAAASFPATARLV